MSKSKKHPAPVEKKPARAPADDQSHRVQQLPPRTADTVYTPAAGSAEDATLTPKQ